MRYPSSRQRFETMNLVLARRSHDPGPEVVTARPRPLTAFVWHCIGLLVVSSITGNLKDALQIRTINVGCAGLVTPGSRLFTIPACGTENVIQHSSLTPIVQRGVEGIS